MNISCSNQDPCPVILDSKCVIYEGENLLYIGVNTNDNFRTALQNINDAIGNILLTGGITELIGDVVAVGPGVASATLATVNSTPGQYGSSTAIPKLTVDGKGRVTAITTEAVFIPSGALDFIGDVTGTGNTGTNTTLTLATVNPDVYTSNTFLKFAANGKGLITSATAVVSGDIITALGYTPAPTGNYITDLNGEATATGPGSATITLNNGAVTGKILTGVNVTGGTVLATDTILEGIGKLQNQINGLIGGSTYEGTWDADTNTPTLVSSVGVDGHYYIVSVAGNTNLNGITSWHVGDWAIFHAGIWQKVDTTDAVVSVNGQIGAVSLTTDNISEGATNRYFTNTRARQAFSAGTGLSYDDNTGIFTSTITQYTDALARGAISLTTTNTSGPATYSSSTGILNIPVYSPDLSGYVPTSRTLTINGVAYDLSADRAWTIAGGVTSFNTRTGAITLTSGDVTSALGYTPANGASYVPYTGATGAVNLGSQNISAAIAFLNGATNYGQGALQLNTNGGGVVLNVDSSNFGILFRNTASGNKLWDLSSYGNDFVINEGGVGARMYFQAGGNVGIGTSSPLSKLQVVGTGTVMRLGEASGSTGKQFLFGVDATTGRCEIQSVWQGTANTPLGLNIAGGNVLVGTTTDNGAKLQVAGTGTFSSSITASSIIKSGGTSNQYLMADGSVSTGPSLSGYVPTSRVLTINGVSYNLTADASWTVASGTTLNGTGFVKASGTSISYDNTSYLPLSGGANMTGSFGLNDSKLYLRGNGDENHFLWNATDDWEELRAYSGTGFRVQSTNGNTIAKFSSSGADANVIDIGPDTGGNNGIGIRNGNCSNCYGRIRFYEGGTNSQTIHTFSSAWQGGSFVSSSAGSINLDGLNGVTFGDWNNVDGYVQTGGNAWFRGNVTAYSDARVKTNIRPIENALQKVLNSRGVIYDRTDIDSKNNIGFIAQELEKNIAELVNTDTEGKKSVQYQNMTAILVEAIKEQQAQIEELKTIINGFTK